MYLDQHLEADINKNIDELEKAINEYRGEKIISPARKLIQKGFKDFLDEKLKIK